MLFSPSQGEQDATELADWILQDQLPVRMQIQLHKVLWGNTPGNNALLPCLAGADLGKGVCRTSNKELRLSDVRMRTYKATPSLRERAGRGDNINAMKKAVVLLSGGLDSITALSLAQEQGFDCYALSLDYGQRHNAELAAAQQLA